MTPDVFLEQIERLEKSSRHLDQIRRELVLVMFIQLVTVGLLIGSLMLRIFEP